MAYSSIPSEARYNYFKFENQSDATLALSILRYFCGYVVTTSDLRLAHVVPPIQSRLTAKP